MTDESMERASSTTQRRPIGLWLSAALLLLVVAWAGMKLVRIGTSARGLMAELQALESLDVADVSELDQGGLVAVRNQFASMEAHLATIQAEAGPFLPLGRYLGWLPRFGGEAQAAPELLAFASDLASAGRAAMDGALPVLAAVQGGGEGSVPARAVAALQATAPQWQEAQAALERATSTGSALDLEGLDPAVTAQLSRIDGYLPQLRTAVGMATLAPSLLGADAPRTYLLLAQNSDELRPTGGFISGVGVLTVDRGQVGDLRFQDSYSVYNPGVDHPPAPADLERYMQAEILLLRDANWSPDFATSAAVARSLYALDTGQETDGVIAFDVEAARRLVASVAPLALPGYAEPITGDNLITAMRAIWAAPPDAEGTVLESYSSDWWLHRKDFMGDLAAAARAKVESGDVDPAALAWSLWSGLQEKHLLVSLVDPAGSAMLADLAWDGRLRPGDQDYLFVVDSNVGWNKVNPLVERSTAYRATLNEDGTVRSQLDMAYVHQGQPTDEPCIHAAQEYGESYEELTRRCYFDYVRVYVPQGARLVSAEGFEPDTVATLSGERGTTVFAGFLVVPPATERRVRLVYDLPAGQVDDDTYTLSLQKQPGTPSWPVQVTLVDSRGAWQPVSSPDLLASEGSTATVELGQDTQLRFERVE